MWQSLWFPGFHVYEHHLILPMDKYGYCMKTLEGNDCLSLFLVYVHTLHIGYYFSLISIKTRVAHYRGCFLCQCSIFLEKVSWGFVDTNIRPGTNMQYFDRAIQVLQSLDINDKSLLLTHRINPNLSSLGHCANGRQIPNRGYW